MKLSFRTLGEGVPLVILHGLFGSADNWQTVGKALSEKFKVYLVDQRNHGNSPHSDAFNYDLLVDDLNELIDGEGHNNVILIGHSMGGKAAMNFAVKYPEKVDKLIIVDIGPKQYPPHHENIFDGFKSIELSKIASRKEADEQLSAAIPDFGVRLFILKNLTRDDAGNFIWKINLGSLENNATEVGRALNPNDIYNGQTMFIGGGNSNYIKAEDEEMILRHFPQARIEMITGSGHWVHAEKPKEFYDLVLDFLSK